MLQAKIEIALSHFVQLPGLLKFTLQVMNIGKMNRPLDFEELNPKAFKVLNRRVISGCHEWPGKVDGVDRLRESTLSKAQGTYEGCILIKKARCKPYVLIIME